MNTTRTWKCPDCWETREISYDWLAEHSGPICELCDCDMDIQPEAEARMKRGDDVIDVLGVQEVLDWIQN